jgi:hypothetical protein
VKEKKIAIEKRKQEEAKIREQLIKNTKINSYRDKQQVSSNNRTSHRSSSIKVLKITSIKLSSFSPLVARLLQIYL